MEPAGNRREGDAVATRSSTVFGAGSEPPRAELAEVRLRVRPGLVLDLAEAAEAHRQLEGRSTVGKVVLRVPQAWRSTRLRGSSAGPGSHKGQRTKKKTPVATRATGVLKKNPAATYSPARFPAKYHRLWRA
ncbi:zinc-binding dehydrogenase, partial [Pyxidicoccus caerfyrddinensis]|uniref:zinc-binding dehydrogenase n=1 Tax=Pyxidicoccus caerfyrddinensis TaxID=2709663 RepID=UPI0013DB5D5B